MAKRHFTAASLFCGAGGLDLGFEKAGFKTIWANDWDVDSCATFKKWNKDAIVVCGDINKISPSMIPDVDILLGGFPCQGFSLSGPRRLDDKRNVLYQRYVHIVREKQPLMFVGENVKGLLSMGGGQIIDAIIYEFSEAGYDVYYKLLNASDYGVPEDRERVIICGFRKDLKITSFEYPEPLEKKISIREALAGIEDPGEVCDAPYSSRYMSRNRRREWDDVSYTIPAMAKQCPLWPGSPKMEKIDSEHWKFGEEGQTRRFGWREAAAIQTFPKDMKFYGDLTSIYKQIGNAVPVNLAKAIASHLLPILEQATAGK